MSVNRPTDKVAVRAAWWYLKSREIDCAIDGPSPDMVGLIDQLKVLSETLPDRYTSIKYDRYLPPLDVQRQERRRLDHGNTDAVRTGHA
jgi:hypothetical protein